MSETEVFRLTKFDKNKCYECALSTKREGTYPNDKYYTKNALKYLGNYTHSESWGYGDGGGGAENFDDNGKKTRIVVSIIRQKLIDGKLENAIDFWSNKVGVDEVITRKFLSWDDNTSIDLTNSVDPNLYNISNSVKNKKEPCVWPFERLNIDTLGRVALCGQDISFRTSKLFPNANEASVSAIWNGQTFSNYRQKHLEGDGSTLIPCNNCSAWKAGIRDWEHGWIKVLDKSANNLHKVFKHELGTEVEIYTPEM